MEIQFLRHICHGSYLFLQQYDLIRNILFLTIFFDLIILSLQDHHEHKQTMNEGTIALGSDQLGLKLR